MILVGGILLTASCRLIHLQGLVGHLEDIAVSKNQQGKKLGLRIIQALDYVAKNVGCYKVSALTSLEFLLFRQAL